MIRFILLGLLRYDGPQHGYALMKAVQARTRVPLSIGNVYRELSHLGKNGLARPAPNPPGSDPRRIPYEITPAGILLFEAWLSEMPRKTLAAHHDELGARAMFLGQVGPEVGSRIIESWRQDLELHGKTLERAHDAAVPSSGARDPMSLLALFLRRSLGHLSVDVAFIQELRALHARWDGGARRNGRQAAAGPPPGRRLRRV